MKEIVRHILDNARYQENVSTASHGRDTRKAAPGSYDAARFQACLAAIQNWDLFLMFLIIDGSSRGKDRAKLLWSIGEIRKTIDTTVDESWVP